MKSEITRYITYKLKFLELINYSTKQFRKASHWKIKEFMPYNSQEKYKSVFKSLAIFCFRNMYYLCPILLQCRVELNKYSNQYSKRSGAIIPSELDS